MRRRCLRGLAVLLAAAAALPGYIRERNTIGSLIVRTGIDDVRFVINDQTAPGMANSDGAVIITPGSDPLRAIRTAAELWTAIPQSAIRFQPLETAAVSPSGSDGRHLVTFQDSTEIRDLVGDATAITLFFSTQGGVLRDTDIYLNPAIEAEGGGVTPFSTDGAPGTYDIQATVLHEFGHALGLNHTNVLGATMFQFGREGEVFAGTLTPDDIAFAVDVYPAPSGQGEFGRIRGTALLDDGRPILGGAVAAVNPTTGTAIGGLTDLESGTYSFLAPPGEYVVYLEPLNGPLDADALRLAEEQVTTPFQATRFGGADGGQTVNVTAGGDAIVDFTTIAGPPALDIALWGVIAGDFIALGTGPRELAVAGTELFLWGPGIENVAEQGLHLLGPAVTLIPGTVRFDPRLVVEGFNGALRFKVNVTPPQAPSQLSTGGSLSTIAVRAGGAFAALTAAVVIEKEFVGSPAFSAAGVANAASFAAGPVAPGQLVSIFGLDVGPAEPVSITGFDPATGLLPTQLGGVEVSFDGIRAPLIFVSKNQINLQAPYELAGRPSTRITVTNGGLPSPGVNVPVTAASPGLFVVGGTAGAILNQDSTLNTAANPAVRGGAVIVFGTGQGEVGNPVPTGAPARGNPLSGRNGMTATVGGRPAQVLFAGLAPDFVGLLQVNLLLPDDVPSGDAVPVQIFVDGVASQAGVTLAIAP